MQDNCALTVAEIDKDDRVLDEKGVRTIFPVSGPTLKRQRKHPNPNLRFPAPDLRFVDGGKAYWYESTVHRYLRQVAEYRRREPEPQREPEKGGALEDG